MDADTEQSLKELADLIQVVKDAIDVINLKHNKGEYHNYIALAHMKVEGAFYLVKKIFSN